MINKDETFLYLVATPIGNLKDISERAKEVLQTCDIIVCENPKHSLKLLNKLGIKKKLISLHDYNENIVINKLSKYLGNKNVALISDAGSPLVSDPGFKLVKFCIDNNLKITSIPGPTSIIPALQLSGISINQFCFLGFLPKSNKQIDIFINDVVDNKMTSVFFVSNNRLSLCLEVLQKKIKKRQISVSKELTKINENTYWSDTNIDDRKFSNLKENLKGEFVIVVEGKTRKNINSISLENYNNEIIKLLNKFSLTDVVEIVHKLTGITKNRIYKWVLKLKRI
tara:strand:- start:15587 stop:16435 length:849 start_codon:yes stop_codon:yes gene_type:complete